MDTQELVSYLDDLLFSSTGERIDSLQVAILKGVLKGQKYADIAQEFNCSAGHAKDKAYKLWQTLSDVLGEEITKSNFRARIEKITATNSKVFRNTIQIGKFNLCSNSSPDIEEIDDVIMEDQSILESGQKIIKRETIPRLVKLGLTAEQIAEALDLPLTEVQKIIAVSN
jgi:DNA-binding NarL/FixJ family response regulator